MENIPSWLRSIDNGKIGEARTKSFLINKFWILERNVDIQGADFIIQRKIFDENLLDRDPPKLGYVQSKFCMNQETVINIKREYIKDNSDALRTEFFLIVHTGYYETESMYYFETKDIEKQFSYGDNTYYLNLKAITEIKSALVASKEFVLDKIDYALKNTRFKENRLFYSLLAGSNKNFQIDFGYTLPLSNNYGNIEKLFGRARERFVDLVRDLEYDTKTLREILAKTDPSDFFASIESGNFYFLEDFFYNNHKYIEEELVSAIHTHRQKVTLLEHSGILQSYISMKKYVHEFLIKQIDNNTSLSENTYFSIDINPDNFSIKKIELMENSTVIDNENIHHNYSYCDTFILNGTIIIWINTKILRSIDRNNKDILEYSLDKLEDLLFEKKYGPDWYNIEL